MADGSGARRSLQQRATRAHRAAVKAVAAEVVKAAPVDTGQLKRSVRVTGERSTATGVTATVEVRPPRTPAAPDNVKVAGFNEYGTRPHVIRAKRGKTLRFVTGGQVRFAASVQHPGTKARPFYYPALRRWPQAIRQSWRSGR